MSVRSSRSRSPVLDRGHGSTEEPTLRHNSLTLYKANPIALLYPKSIKKQ